MVGDDVDAAPRAAGVDNDAIAEGRRAGEEEECEGGRREEHDSTGEVAAAAA